MPRNDKTFLNLIRYIDNKEYFYTWEEESKNSYVNSLLQHTSKQNNGKNGHPDLLYINEEKKILILLELKTSISQHEEAKSDIKHYLKFYNRFLYPKDNIYNFNSSYIQNGLNFFESFNIFGLAVSGNICSEINKVDTYLIKDNNIIDLNISSIKNEQEYEYLIRNIDKEEAIKKITQASTRINNLLYDIKEDKRPTLLSILLISLFPSSKVRNDFIDDYVKKEPSELFDYIEIIIKKILGTSGENIPLDKINIIISEISTFKNEKVLTSQNIIKTILDILKNDVIPLFYCCESYDIIGRFYQEFLRYAGIVDVQSGIVLTPEHITDLFTELVPIKKNDVILDCCCGTGAFLVSGMRKLLSLQNNENDKELVKRQQLIGNEIKPHMFILAISNMLFRGDGKSTIFNTDFFTKDFDNELEELKNNGIEPTIGFINPPYSGGFTNYKELSNFRSNSNNKNKNKKPWMKEISFLAKMCKICSKYVVMIAPPQTFMSEKELRNELLLNNTIKAVISMPKDLFQPNASTGSSIIVIQTHIPHDFNKKIIFYNLKDDGFELAKKQGRRDVYHKWDKIKQNLLENIDAPYYNNVKNVDNYMFCYNTIENNSEWNIQAYSKVDWKCLNQNHFEKTIKSYVIFKAKYEMDKLIEKIDDTELLTLYETLDKSPVITSFNKETKFKEYKLIDIFNKPYGCKKKITKKELKEGNYFWVTTSNKNNGVSGFHCEFSETGNAFTIDSATDGKCFYQELPFIGSDHVEILRIKEEYNQYLNIYTANYLTTILNFYLDKYAYERKRAQERIINETLYLPTTDKDKPDWDYMEKFIKSLPYSSNL